MGTLAGIALVLVPSFVVIGVLAVMRATLPHGDPHRRWAEDEIAKAEMTVGGHTVPGVVELRRPTQIRPSWLVRWAESERYELVDRERLVEQLAEVSRRREQERKLEEGSDAR